MPAWRVLFSQRCMYRECAKVSLMLRAFTIASLSSARKCGYVHRPNRVDDSGCSAILFRLSPEL